MTPQIQFLPHQNLAQALSAFSRAVVEENPQQESGARGFLKPDALVESSPEAAKPARVESRSIPSTQPTETENATWPRLQGSARSWDSPLTSSDRTAINSANSAPGESLVDENKIGVPNRLAKVSAATDPDPIPTPVTTSEEAANPAKTEPITAPQQNAMPQDSHPVAPPVPVSSATIATPLPKATPLAPLEVRSPDKPAAPPSRSATQPHTDVLPKGQVDSTDRLAKTSEESVIKLAVTAHHEPGTPPPPRAESAPIAPPPSTLQATTPESAPAAEIIEPAQDSIQTPTSPSPKDVKSRRSVSRAAEPALPAPTQGQSAAPIQGPKRAVDYSAPVASAQSGPATVGLSELQTPDIQGTTAAQRSEPSEPSVVLPEPAVISDTPETPITPKSENLAFAVHMLVPREAAVQPLPAQSFQAKQEVIQPKLAQPPQPTPQRETQSPSLSNSKREVQSPASTTEGKDTRLTKGPDLPQHSQPPQIVTRWTEVIAPRPYEVNSFSLISSESAAPSHVSDNVAARETHVILPELPKAPTSTDILLHFTGSDRSAGSVRVAERAGSVNISVHASDPDLRESLRSNLGELTSQLNGQGWKAEALAPAPATTQSDGQQNSQGRGQGSSQHDQSFGGDRQPQRDRRTPGQWQQEFDQQISSGDARPGGNR